jgi:hypothetical protein
MGGNRRSVNLRVPPTHPVSVSIVTGFVSETSISGR